MDADILCFQETKVTRDMLTEPLGKLIYLLYTWLVSYATLLSISKSLDLYISVKMTSDSQQVNKYFAAV